MGPECLGNELRIPLDTFPLLLAQPFRLSMVSAGGTAAGRSMEARVMNYPFKYRPLALALYEALTEDAFYVAMENGTAGSPVQRREAMLRYYDYSMQEGRKYGAVFITSGLAAGASIWLQPLAGNTRTQMAHQKNEFLRRYMGDNNLSIYKLITTNMNGRTKAVVPPGSWYLSILGIAPPFQGQGLGETLMRPMLKQTDVHGCHTYLETFTSRNMRFYKKLGFQEAGDFNEPFTRARYWVMVRAPLQRRFDSAPDDNCLMTGSIHNQPSNQNKSGD